MPQSSTLPADRPAFFLRKAQGALGLILIVYFILAPLYSLSIPPLESPDAYYHYGVIHHFSNTLELPPYENPELYPWTHAVFHAPLYYMLSGLLIAPIDTTDFPEEWPRNPHARIGLPHSINNHNFVSFKVEPWQQSYLAVYVIRAFSMFWGAVSLVSIFLLGRFLFPDRLLIALFAGLFVTLTPQFLYMSAVINNDNMVVALSLVTLTMLVYAIRYGYSWKFFALMGLAMAAGALAKVNALPLYPTVALGLLYLAWRDKWSVRQLFSYGLTILAIWAVLDGWWYLQNWILFGDPTGTEQLAIAAGGASGVPTGLDNLWNEFVGVYYSFWGLFGWFNIIAPPIFYHWVTVFLGIAGVGLLYALFRRPTNTNLRIIILLLLVHAGGVFFGWWRFRAMVQAAQGRMLFSVLAVLAIGLAYGLLVWKPKILRVVPLVFLIGMGVAAFSFPFTLLAPAYKIPDRLNELPEFVNQVDVRYGPVVLRGYTIDPTPVNYWEYQIPEDREFVKITLYWQPLERTDIPLSMFVQVFAPDNTFEPIEVGKVDSYPGRGMMRTDTWETDIIYADTYYLEVYGDFELTPFEPRFRVGLRDNETDTYIQATTIDGEPIEAVVPRGGSVYSTEVTCEPLENTANVNYQGLAQLTGWDSPDMTVSAGDTLELELQWDVLSTTPDEYRVFVQLIDPDMPETLYGSGDSAPRDDWYPTYRWVEGVCFDDTYFITVNEETPPGDYRVLIGWYRPDVDLRLTPETDRTENLLGGGYLLDATITVE